MSDSAAQSPPTEILMRIAFFASGGTLFDLTDMVTMPHAVSPHLTQARGEPFRQNKYLYVKRGKKELRRALAWVNRMTRICRAWLKNMDWHSIYLQVQRDLDRDMTVGRGALSSKMWHSALCLALAVAPREREYVQTAYVSNDAWAMLGRKLVGKPSARLCSMVMIDPANQFSPAYRQPPLALGQFAGELRRLDIPEAELGAHVPAMEEWQTWSWNPVQKALEKRFDGKSLHAVRLTKIWDTRKHRWRVAHPSMRISTVRHAFKLWQQSEKRAMRVQARIKTALRKPRRKHP